MIRCDRGFVTMTYDVVPELTTELEFLLSRIYREIIKTDDEEAALFMMVSVASNFCKEEKISPQQLWKAIEMYQQYEQEEAADVSD